MWMGGMYDLKSSNPELYAQRRPSRLGVSGGAWREVRCARTAGGDVHTAMPDFGYHIGDVETAVLGRSTPSRWSTTTAVATRGKRGFDRVYGGQQTEQARELWTFRKTNFARIAEEMGALGIRVENASAFPAALAQASRPTVLW